MHVSGYWIFQKKHIFKRFFLSLFIYFFSLFIYFTLQYVLVLTYIDMNLPWVYIFLKTSFFFKFKILKLLERPYEALKKTEEVGD